MSGGKGGSSTTEVKIPEYIEAAAQRNLNKAERISQLGYVPQYGPDVAAFTPMQQASFQNTANAANAFGMAAPTSQRDIMGGMDAPTTYAGGVQGYSSAPMYQQSIDALAAARPAQKSYIDSFFIDPTTGNYAYQPMDYTNYATNAANERAAVAREGGGGEGRDGGYGGGTFQGPNPDGSAGYSNGFVSFGDMFDGGGPGASGVGYTGARDMVDGGGPNASTAGGRNFAGPNPDGSAGNDGPGGGCVVATHAVESGAFTPKMKREAVVWCMQALHGKWWGEAVRRGYRHLGRKKIEQGKAREHYAEFSRYIQFANGKKRDVRGAVTFALRTAQFFAVGLVKKDA
jgi:hypothetical protein